MATCTHNRVYKKQLTAGIISHEIALPVDVVVSIEGVTAGLYVVELLAVEDDALEALVGRDRGPGARQLGDAAMVVAQLLRDSARFLGYRG